MTREEFQKVYAADYKMFLETNCGKAFMATLAAMIPAVSFSDSVHLFAEDRGCRRGYEMCLRNSLFLAAPVRQISDVEVTYGVPSKPEVKV